MKTTENVRQKAGYSFFAAISAKVSSNIRLGISFALVSEVAPFIFPCASLKRKEVMIGMKLLKNIIFSVVVMVSLSLSVSSQHNDQKKPPKGNPPVVTPPDKTRPRENPPRDNGGDKGRGGGKKPGLVSLLSGPESNLEIS
jgi:hypothetical protein